MPLLQIIDIFRYFLRGFHFAQISPLIFFAFVASPLSGLFRQLSLRVADIFDGFSPAVFDIFGCFRPAQAFSQRYCRHYYYFHYA
jgi:hypothetical protein